MRRPCLAVLVALAWPAPSRAQSDSLGLHATLNSWAEDAWLTILDRDASPGGRLSNQGILHRFQPTIDEDYGINKIRIRPDLLDDYAWYRHTNGARFSGGSLNTRDLGVWAAFKQSVPLGGRWSANVRFDKENLPEAVRDLVRLGFTRTAASGVFEFIAATLTPLKPSDDIEVGAGWRRGDTRVTLSVAALDAFNNLIYQDLGITGNVRVDTALDYERRPLMLHANLDIPLGTRFRFEGHAGVLGPSTVRAYVQTLPDSGFRQDERYSFVGALFEWIASPRVTASGFATYVNAVTDRRPLPYGRPLDDFRLTERTVQAGAHLLARLAPRWMFQSWAARMWRPEWRVYRTAAAPNVDYQEVSWTGQAVLTYGAATGFALSGTLEFDDRRVVRGEGQVPALAPLGGHHNEIRVDFGWRVPSRYAFTVGLGIDIDPGIYPRGWFGGAHGGFVLYW